MDDFIRPPKKVEKKKDKRFVKVRRTDVVHMWKHRYVFFYLQRIAIQLSCDMLYFGADKTAEDPQEG